MSEASKPATAAVPKRRSIVYIDGFNFYYGAIKDGPYKWLDLEKFFTRLRQHDEIQRIYYFTASVSGSALARQGAYLRALETLPLVDCIVSRHKRKRFECGVSRCTLAPPRFYDGVEEKRTDVAIAVQMLDDAQNGRADLLILVSGDSDLVPALDKIRTAHPAVKTLVYVPSRDPNRGAATEIRFAANTNKTLPLDLLKKCQFPEKVPDGAGGEIEKPASW